MQPDPTLAPSGDISSDDQAPSGERLTKLESVVLLGNPNVGKTSLFNALASESARVGNYPGVTVERRVARLTAPSPDGAPVELVDVPGTYSLAARSHEERIAIDAALGLFATTAPTLAVVVIDAGQLVRNLYLVLQLLELRVPTVVALNMIDEAPSPAPDPEKISAVLGVPCIATNARMGIGVDALRKTIFETLGTAQSPRVHVPYPVALRTDLDRIADAMPSEWRGSVERDRALALWALSSIDEEDELEDIPPRLREAVQAVHEGGRDVDLEIVAARYAYLDELEPSLVRTEAPATSKRLWTDRTDRILLHPVFGFVLFLAVMVLLFQSLFSWSDPAIGLLEDGVSWLQGIVQGTLPAGLLRDLLTEGLIGGVGNVLVFLPQILLLFLFIGLLEDSGYMARVAYLMDRIMRSLGLHGRAFVPMLSGFACAVPAILATRTMERRRDRLLTMLVVPLMTCSARLPVYTLLIAALFPPNDFFGLPVQGLLMVAMYLFSVFVALVAAAVLGRTVVPGKSVPLILELPPYRLPRLSATLRMMRERAGQFLREAGGVIMVCTIAMWGLLSFPKADATSPSEAYTAAHALAAAAAPTSESVSVSEQRPGAEPTAPGDASEAARALENSYGGRLGKAIEPVMKPLGFDWKMTTGIIGAFAAREVFVSTLGLVHGIAESDEESAPLREKLQNEKRVDGSPAYTPLVGLSLMIFFALACQCMSTLAVVRRETQSWRWPAFLFGYMTALAYAASFLVYQGGRLLGF